MLRRFYFATFVLPLVLAAGTVRAQAVISERSLSTDAAIEAATAALKQCRQDGYQVAVTVLDQAGRTKAVVSDDHGRLHTVEHSLRKAYTALTYRRPSGEYGERVASTPTAAGTLHLDKITTAAGGLPIRAGNDVVGAIGVSGSPGGDKDEVCAKAGIDRIAAGLGG
jgi:uncharacterized protein GlcG (DUF336 family)